MAASSTRRARANGRSSSLERTTSSAASTATCGAAKAPSAASSRRPTARSPAIPGLTACAPTPTRAAWTSCTSGPTEAGWSRAFCVGSHVDGSETAILSTQRSSTRYFQRPDARRLTFDPNAHVTQRHGRHREHAQDGWSALDDGQLGADDLARATRSTTSASSSAPTGAPSGRASPTASGSLARSFATGARQPISTVRRTSTGTSSTTSTGPS